MTMSNSTPSNEDLDASFAAKLTEIHRLLDTGNLEEAKQMYENVMRQVKLLFQVKETIRDKFLDLIPTFSNKESVAEPPVAKAKPLPKWLLQKPKPRIHLRKPENQPESDDGELEDEDEDLCRDLLFRFFEVRLGLSEATREENKKEMEGGRECLRGLTDEHPKEEVLEAIAPLLASPPPGKIGVALMKFFSDKGWLSFNEEEQEPDENDLREIEEELKRNKLL